MREMDAKRLARYRDRFIEAHDADDFDAMATLCVELIEALDTTYQIPKYDATMRQRMDGIELRLSALEKDKPIPSYRPPYSAPRYLPGTTTWK
jgi:hypothetical protein